MYSILIQDKFLPRNYCRNYRLVKSPFLNEKCLEYLMVLVSTCKSYLLINCFNLDSVKKRKTFLVTSITKPKNKSHCFDDGNLLPAHGGHDINISKKFNLDVTD